MQHKSLAFRLIASSALWSVLILVVAGYLFSSLFRAAVERTFDERLVLTLDGLLANIEYDDQGRLIESATLGESRYLFPLQGWYWQVSPLDGGTGGEIRSPSLLEKRLEFPAESFGPRDENGLSRFYHDGPEGHRLRVIEQKYQIDPSAQKLSFMVTGNADELEAEIAAFDRTLMITLSALAAGLVMTVILQVGFGIRPLRRLRRALVRVRTGETEHLEGEYPGELQPVIRELNALLRANNEIVERSRTQVGNLAHALKTPLSVLKNEADAARTPFAEKIVEQANIMSDQIDLYLDRARRAARATALGSSCAVRPVVEGLVRTLRAIHAGRAISTSFDGVRPVRFLGERQDLEEMTGNLLDNAFKWAVGKVRVEARIEPLEAGGAEGRLVLSVEDDGPGLPREQHEHALMRGRRLDETKPGSGLGLSIVAETVAMYDGEITLDVSALGGLRVVLDLPGADPAATPAP